MISVIGLDPYRVYQRDELGKADIPFELRFPVSGSGSVQIAIASPDMYSAWQTLDKIEAADRYHGSIRALPIGRHRIKFRVIGDRSAVERRDESGTETKASADTATGGVSEIEVDPIFVGDLWVLAGQSNMKGFGKLSWTEPPQLGVSCFYMDDRWNLAEDPLCWLNESTDPVHWTVPAEQRIAAAAKERLERTQGAGLGISFAKKILHVTGIPIGLIPCAKGSTSMEDWAPERISEGGNSLYGAMMRRIEKLGGKIRGCLWYQGESDANEASAPHYRERMRHWIDKLRHDLADADLPFLYAQLSVHYADADAKWWNMIQHEQLVLEHEMERVAVIPTIDAGLSDVIHLDAQSLRSVGKRMAWQALKLVYGTELYASGPRPAKQNDCYWNEDRTTLELKLSGINGELQEVDRIAGFQLESDGQAIPFAASLSPDRRSIRFQFDQSVSPAAKLWHGRGLNPLVNVIDEQHIPLIVFGPLDI